MASAEPVSPIAEHLRLFWLRVDLRAPRARIERHGDPRLRAWGAARPVADGTIRLGIGATPFHWHKIGTVSAVLSMTSKYTIGQ
jgi:hypothetical protein